MDGDFESFDSEAQVQFEERLAEVMGVDPSQLNIIGYNEGSIVVIFDVYPAEGQSLEELAGSQAQVFSKEVDLGYPVMALEAKLPGEQKSAFKIEDGVFVDESGLVEEALRLQAEKEEAER